MKTPHKHAELIKAWADGAEIEARQPQREWVGLTNEEIINISCGDLHFAALIGEVIRKLKEKNT